MFVCKLFTEYFPNIVADTITSFQIVTRVRRAASDSKKAPQRMKELDSKELDRRVRHPNDHVPVLPDWRKLRPNMSMDFRSEIASPRSMRDVPVCSQEHKLMEDLVYVLCGLTGEYITPLPLLVPNQPRRFEISEGVDTSLRELLEKILPLASAYSIIVRFIEEKSSYHYGQVNQALASAMNLIINDYKVVNSLERNINFQSSSVQCF